MRRLLDRPCPLPSGPVSSVVVPALAVLTIVALDLAQRAGDWPVPVWGLMDEPAHLLTAWLALLVVPAWRPLGPWVLLGAVAIDADHAGLYVSRLFTPEGGGRPITHSLLTVVVLLGVALALPRARTVATGLAIGVLLHFARDIATDTGLPLLWPAPQAFLVPYWIYVAVISALAAIAVIAALSRPRTARSPVTAGSRTGLDGTPPEADGPCRRPDV